MQAEQRFSYEVVTPHYSELGEGPVWDRHTKSICWVDILSGCIHEFTPSTGQYRCLHLAEMVGAIAVCTNGDFIAALKSGLAFINRDTGRIERLHHPELHLPGNRFNDGKCDPAGRFWVGSMALAETPQAGSLYMVEKDLSHSVKIKGVSISNGMAWSADKKKYYYIDTPSYEVVAYDYDVDTGHISNKKTAITIPEKDGFPDGMTIDKEDMLWIAHWDGWQITRWDPRSGEKLLSIALPAARITSCTFGGDDLQDLYITSAKTGLGAAAVKQPLAGGLFVIKDIGFYGVEATAFRHEAKG